MKLFVLLRSERPDTLYLVHSGGRPTIALIPHELMVGLGLDNKSSIPTNFEVSLFGYHYSLTVDKTMVVTNIRDTTDMNGMFLPFHCYDERLTFDVLVDKDTSVLMAEGYGWFFNVNLLNTPERTEHDQVSTYVIHNISKLVNYELH